MTMEVIGLKEVAIAKLILPGDIRQRVNSPDVLSRARSIEEYGIIHEPLVRRRDMRLIAGRDRVAAHIHLGRASMVVKLVDCSDQDCLELERVENLERRQDPSAQTRLSLELVELTAKRIAAELVPEPGAPPVKRGKGRPKTARTLARERVAEERGIQPDSLRRIENLTKQRDKKKPPEAAPEPVMVQPTEPTIRTIGMILEPDFVRSVRDVQDAIETASGRLSVALSGLTRLQTHPYPAPKLQQLRQELQQLAADVRGSYPVSLCPFCKGLSGVQEKCGACSTTGWIGRDQEEGVPAELWREDKPLVMVHGKPKLVTDMIPQDTAPYPPTPPADEWF